MHRGRGRESRAPEVIIHVEDIGEQRLGGGLLHVQLLHLVGHHDCLTCDFLSGPEIDKEVNKINAPERALCLGRKDVCIYMELLLGKTAELECLYWSIQSRP